MIQADFASRAKTILAGDDNVIGLAAAGSWLTNEIDEFSDLDLVLVTHNPVAGNTAAMLAYAGRLGPLLSGFTGEHVGEPRLLICLYDDPLLHVDIKFLALDEFHTRIETPVILLDTNNQLQTALQNSTPTFPYPDFQWIEDRFWTWVHYALLKTGRGEYVEACDFFGFLRMTVLGPLLHLKNGHLPRGVRKAETTLAGDDLYALQNTIPRYGRPSLLASLRNTVALYRQLRIHLFKDDIILQQAAEQKVMEYFEEVEKSSLL